MHAATPISVCESRDSKGLYAKARAGLLPEFTGVSDPYETPADAEITIDTSTTSSIDAVQRIMRFLREKSYL